MLQLPIVMLQRTRWVRGKKTFHNVCFWCSMIMGLSLVRLACVLCLCVALKRFTDDSPPALADLLALRLGIGERGVAPAQSGTGGWCWQPNSQSVSQSACKWVGTWYALRPNPNATNGLPGKTCHLYSLAPWPADPKRTTTPTWESHTPRFPPRLPGLTWLHEECICV
jgi:hypothetical protein